VRDNEGFTLKGALLRNNSLYHDR